MAYAPFRHDRASSGNDSRKTFADQFGMSFQYAGMYGEVVYPLFALFDKCVAVDFPREVFGYSVYFFEGLVNGYCAHRNGAVADNPFAGLVYVVTRR